MSLTSAARHLRCRLFLTPRLVFRLRHPEVTTTVVPKWTLMERSRETSFGFNPEVFPASGANGIAGVGEAIVATTKVTKNIPENIPGRRRSLGIADEMDMTQ